MALAARRAFLVVGTRAAVLATTNLQKREVGEDAQRPVEQLEERRS
jgi:hypothetical protein